MFEHAHEAAAVEAAGSEQQGLGATVAPRDHREPDKHTVHWSSSM